MLVKAKRIGYYNLKRRREGDVFELKEMTGYKKIGDKLEKVAITAEQQFSDSWMEQVEEDDGDERPMRELAPKKKSLKEASKEVI
jgi:hypothetical protein